MGAVKNMLIELLDEYPDAKSYSELLRFKTRKENKLKKLKPKRDYGKERSYKSKRIRN